ncbi:MAG: type 4b pilus protein PilO2 [Acidiferrobacterales bacterium]
MGTGIIRLPGDPREYLVGMHWETHENRPSGARIREIAQTEGQWVAVRRGMSTIQSGYCVPLGERRSPKGLASLAAMVADAKPEPWLGVFDMGDGRYWCVAVRENNSILLNGDFLGSFEEVSAIREQLESIGTWSYMDGGLEDLAALLASGHARSAPVRDAFVRPWIAPALKIGAGVLVVGAGLWMWHQHEVHERLDRARALARQRAILAALAAKKSPILLPWARLPSPSQFLHACGTSITSLPLSVDGWLLARMSCASSTDQMITSTLWHVSKGATAAASPAGILAKDGQTIVGMPTRSAVAASKNNRIDHQQEALRALYAALAPLGVPVSITGTVAAATLPGGAVSAVSTAKPWRQLHVSFRTSLPVLSSTGLGAALDQVPGFRLTSVHAAPAGPWVLAGSLYVAHRVTLHAPAKIALPMIPAARVAP